MGPPQLLVIGDITVDLFLSLPRLPERGADAHADRMLLRAGGSAANTAAAAAALGLPPALLGAVGQDPLGEWALEALRASGVDLSLLQRRTEASTSLIVIAVTPDGERTMLSWRGASRFFHLEAAARALLPRAAFLHVSGYALLDESPMRSAAMTLLEAAWGAGCRCTLDPGLPACRMAPEAVWQALRWSDALFLSEGEAALLLGPDPRQGFRAAERLQWIVIKRGAEGCRLLGREGEDLQIPAFTVPVVDTTGAGDAFDAGFLVGLARGLHPAAAALLGNAAGAIACTVWGVIGAFPGWPALRALLERHRGRPEWAPWRDALEAIYALATPADPPASR